MLRILCSLLLAGTLAGCASGGGTPRGERNVITAEELAGIQVASAYDAVLQLRPQFLRSRGAASLRDPRAETAAVYINGTRAGTIDVLRALRLNDVQEIRYLSAVEASTRYGINHAAGVIEVRTRS
jgi:hypothetical protein